MPTFTAVDPENIAELVALAKEGSSEAGPYLVSLCGARLARYVSLINRSISPADLEAVCEQAIERAVQHIEDFDPNRASFDAWVRGFVRFVLLEHHRAGQSVPTDPAELPAIPPSESSSATSPLISPLKNALGNLAETDQMIIQLRTFEQLPYESIAELLNVQPAACRQRHARALGRLRREILANPEAALFLKKDNQ
jgi:RNA polymerase sigma factor (sigma-70 family)